MNEPMLQGKRLFYIEDNIENRAIAQTILERHGAQVGFERWGREDTLKRLADFGPVDGILLDLMFPKGVTGYDVLARLRAVSAFQLTPIIAVSAADPSIEIPKTQAAGFAGFISKPIDIRHFPRQVAQCLRGYPVWAQS